MENSSEEVTKTENGKKYIISAFFWQEFIV